MEESIKAELKKQGLPEGLYSYIKVEKTEEIEGAVTALKGALPKAETQSYATLDEMFAAFPGLKVLYEKALTAEGDRRVETKKMKGLDKKDKAGATDLTETEEKIKAIVGPMFEKLLEGIKEDKATITVANRKNEAITLIKEAGIDEKAIDLINLESETPIADQVKGVETLIETQTQVINDQLIEAGIKPGGGKSTTSDLAETVIKTAAEAKNAENTGKGEGSGFSTKEL